MGWWGWIAGIALGRALTGSGGAGLIGGLIGSLIENAIRDSREERRQEDYSSRRQAAQERQERIFMAALAALLAKMAKADGRITPDEIQYCRELFRRSGFAGERYEFLVSAFRQARDDAHSIYEYARSFAECVPDREVRESLYDILWELAGIDGTYSPEELEYLRRLPEFLNIAAARFSWHERELHSQEPDLSDCYSLLGVAPSASERELKSAYRRKARELHPDTLRARGLPEELLQKATEEMAALNAAWDRICAARGIR